MAFKRSCTTSYHPCSNGMIERVHRQLKASLMCHTDSSWFEALPVVLLGICSVFKEDLQSSSAELETHISRLRPVPASCHARGTPFVFKDLETRTNAMLHDDSIRGALQPTYSEPNRILQRIGKVFVLRIGRKEVRVSVDRIKRAYVLADDTPSSGPC
ncbi:uncharacterized protein TNCV_1363501 [Trichonephila clavipes]|uniref:Integrase catalytic domain-containing protein n=1 Tax=Trichonephila clavipes TaxID=2585209 RepID=A0A8X6RTU1_TRICX|nr:uncharacterized protein TNCV_1363501 [Trichonephila clavipes]